MNISKKISSILVLLVICTTLSWAGEIHNAARNGNLDKVKSLLANNPELLNARDNKGSTPLHSAVSKGREDVVLFLIEMGADIDTKNKNGLTPLFWALDLSRNNVAKILIEKGADISIKGFRNRTLLHMAARSGSTDIVKQLLGKGLSINTPDTQGSTPLDCAVRSGKTETAWLLTEQGGKLNTLKPESEEYETLVNRALYRGETNFIRLIVEIVAELNIKDVYGATLLHRAAALGRYEIVKLLIERGIDINTETDNGRTPLYFTSKYGHRAIAGYLKTRGAAVTKDLEENFGRSSYLDKKLTEKEAVIWYLSHAGWAVKTKNHLLIFDYAELGEKPAEPMLVNGFINPSEIEDLNVSVFVTHEHNDHYDPVIFNWEKSGKNIRYILGFQPRNVPEQKYEYLGPRTTKIIDDMEITTIKSTDSGVGYLVKVDGLDIFHGGDHANKVNDLSGPYPKEIDYLAAKEKKIDIAFLLSGSPCGGGPVESVITGTFYTLEKLSPHIVFPMHGGGNECIYVDLAREAEERKFKTHIVTTQFRGDTFFYKDGTIQ